MIVNDYPTIHLLLRGDSGFAAPDLYKQCEENGTSYVIRLKGNKILREKASFLADALTSRTQNNKVDYAVVYGESMYKAVHGLMKDALCARLRSQKTKWFTCIPLSSQTWIPHQNTLSNFTAKEV